jgi:L,D-transpeptidase catalytic domain
VFSITLLFSCETSDAMKQQPLKKNDLSYRKILTTLVLLVIGFGFYLLLIRLGFMLPLNEISEVLCIKPCQPEKKLHTPPPGVHLLNYDKSLAQLVATGNNKKDISLLIEKSKYRLTLYYNLKPLKSYPVVFGTNPTGDKQGEGDRRTPEGILQIKDLYSHPQWSKFLWLNYPNAQSWRKHFQAKANGQLAWYFPVGGQVGIHGVPIGADRMIDDRQNWTWGCPSLNNKDVDELYQWVQVGTVVEIVP